MAHTPVNFNEWARLQSLPVMARVVINALVENRPFLGMIPGSPWPGGSKYSWTITKSLPTITWQNETADIDASDSAEYNMSVELSQAHGAVMLPIHTQTASNIRSAEVEKSLNLIRAMGRALAAAPVTGTYVKEADVTIRTEVGAKGVDAVVEVSAYTQTGFASLKFDDTDDKVYYRAPGSRTYGAGVVIAGASTDYTFYDGENTGDFVTLTIDSVDSLGNGDWEYHEALSVPRPEKIAGLKGLATCGPASQIVEPPTNGQAVSLSIMDELIYSVLGPTNEKIILANPRTMRSIKALITAAGGMRQEQYQNQDASQYMLMYEGVPIIPEPYIATGETQGTENDATRLYCLRLNRDVGFHMFWGQHTGPNFGTMSAVDDGDALGGSLQLPVYMRKLGEMQDKPAYQWRISAAVASCLKDFHSLSMAYGISN